jgi:hypothetical protein
MEMEEGPFEGASAWQIRLMKRRRPRSSAETAARRSKLAL